MGSWQRFLLMALMHKNRGANAPGAGDVELGRTAFFFLQFGGAVFGDSTTP